MSTLVTQHRLEIRDARAQWMAVVSTARLVIGTISAVALVALAVGFSAWAAVSLATGASILSFQTGSMAPTIPVGSLAVMRPVSASEIHVGDVIAVDRGKLPPVTQRVVGISTDAASASSRIVMLHADADSAASTGTYEVSRARLLVASTPRVGATLELMLRPIPVAPIIAALVVASSWLLPRQEDER